MFFSNVLPTSFEGNGGEGRINRIIGVGFSGAHRGDELRGPPEKNLVYTTGCIIIQRFPKGCGRCKTQKCA